MTVFDTGGGSSQFTFGGGDKVEERFSVDVGAVRLTERYGLDGAVPTGGLTAALAGIGADLAASTVARARRACRRWAAP